MTKEELLKPETPKENSIMIKNQTSKDKPTKVLQQKQTERRFIMRVKGSFIS